MISCRKTGRDRRLTGQERKDAILLGLVKPTAGEIQMFGNEIHSRNRIEVLKRTGSLIEAPSCYGHLNGRENLEIVQTLKQVPREEIDEVLRIVRLEGQQKKKVREYSLGMKQRLGLAAALLGRPKLLLLDEPTNCSARSTRWQRMWGSSTGES